MLMLNIIAHMSWRRLGKGELGPSRPAVAAYRMPENVWRHHQAARGGVVLALPLGTLQALPGIVRVIDALQWSITQNHELVVACGKCK